MTTPLLKVGRISYVNAVPYFHHLAETGFVGEVVSGVPAELNRMLAAGELDLSPSSSFEYALHWRDYLLLPGHSISSFGPVQSVLLFSQLPLEAVAGGEIYLTGESATSVNLMNILLREFYGAGEIVCRVPAVPVEELVAAGASALLIGDRALQLARSVPAGTQIYDLGELWQRVTGLPFVFGLWIVRREAWLTRRAEILTFRQRLDQALRLAFADLEGLAASGVPGSPLAPGELVAYWRTVSYELTPVHLEGLRKFFALCCRHGLLAEEPELCFTE
jgi:chorismate dehydratase